MVAAFIKSDAPEASALVSEMQKLSDQNKAKGLRTFVVVMAGPEAKPAIEKITSEKKITIPVTFLPAGPSTGDILKYKINPEARSTVLLWKKLTVSGGFTNVTAEKWPEVVKATEELVQ